MKDALSRREFLRVSALTAAATVAAACTLPAGTPASPAEPAPTSAPADVQPTAVPAQAEAPTAPPDTETPTSAYKEAPMLAERVAAGELPPVDERLPLSPCVVPVMEMIGKYGGTVRRGFKGMSDSQGPRKVRERSFVWYNSDLSVRPALAESWETNEDASVWTWHLRAGTRWSDGQPFTSADCVWFYEHELLNEELNPQPLAAYATGDPSILAEFSAPDDVTLVVAFAHPNPMFAYRVAWENQPFAPAHYMEQFHTEFADQAALDAAITEAGLETWAAFYANRSREDLNADRPSINAWVPTNTLADELFVMERNPYYWSVDAEGHQLPYVDQVTHRLFEQADVFNLWVVNGEIDFQNRHVSIANYTLFKEGEAAGDYQVMLGTNESHIGLNTNHTAKDARLRELFSTRNVRIALSHAVNRDEMNELVYDGMATPRQYSPMELSPQYDPELSNAYLEYDPDTANALLDEAGYTERNADGLRLWKDGSGEPISIVIEGLAEAGSPEEDAAQLVVRYLADVGLQATYKYLERSLYQERANANDLACGWWGGDRTELPMIDPGIFIGTQEQRPWGSAWGLWKRSGGTDPNGEQPPEGHWIYDIWSAYEACTMEPDYQKRIDLFGQILDIWKRELPQPCYLGQFPAPVIVKNGFRNFIGGYPIARTRCDEQLFGSETYFWEDPEQHA